MIGELMEYTVFSIFHMLIVMIEVVDELLTIKWYLKNNQRVKKSENNLSRL